MLRAYGTADIRAAEEPLLGAGEPLMERAAYAVATNVLRRLRSEGSTIPGSTVLVLVGSGNNGGDGLFAASYLARRGLAVVAAHVPDPHPAGLAAARAAGVRTFELGADAQSLELLRSLAAYAGTWIDALLGTGARGGAREPIATWIRALAEERELSPAEPYVVAVDLPSGLDADFGAVPGPVLRADATVTMGAPKPANLLPPARHVGGRLEVVDLDFEPYLPPTAAVCEVTDADVADLWPVPGPADHKYTRGVLGMVTGSATYPGAGVLGVGAALAVGPGMVRYLGSAPTTSVYPEVVTSPGRVQAWVLGSGLDDLTLAASKLEEAQSEGLPVVLDAGAIELANSGQFSSDVTLTPHSGELVRLLAARGVEVEREVVEADPALWAHRAAELTGATVVHKGAIDVVADPGGVRYAQSGAPTWRGVAGAGDVYAGIFGALLAMTAADEVPAALVAAAASHLHARAATRAADAQGRIGHPISAFDIVHELRAVIDEILNGEHHG